MYVSLDVTNRVRSIYRNALSDFDETWHKYSSYQRDLQNQGHNQVKVMVTGQRSWMSVFATPCRILTKLGTNILLDTTCTTKVTTRSR